MSGGGAAFISPYIVSESDPSILYSGRSTIYKSTNAARSWSATNNGTAFDGNSFQSLAVFPKNPDFVMAATAPTLTGSALAIQHADETSGGMT